MPIVSVIIPTFNRKHLLSRSIGSVFNQSVSDYEIIVVDDGSFDGTDELSILRDKRINYFKLPNRFGVSYARNFGVREANGEWLAFLDSDDEWFPCKLEKQLKWAKNNPEFRIMQTKEIWVRNGVRVNCPKSHQKIAGDLFCASLERCMITPSSVLLQKELFWEAGGFDEALPACEDYDLWIRITAKHRVGLINEFLLTRYGGHIDQLSSSVLFLDRFRIRSLLKLLYQYELTEIQTAMVKNWITRRAEIIANGYFKRGNKELYERFISIANQYR